MSDRQVLASLPDSGEAEALAERLRAEGFTPDIVGAEGGWVQVRLPPGELAGAEAFLADQVVPSEPDATRPCPSCGSVSGAASPPGPVARVLSLFGVRTARCPVCGERR